MNFRRVRSCQWSFQLSFCCFHYVFLFVVCLFSDLGFLCVRHSRLSLAAPAAHKEKSVEYSDGNALHSLFSSPATSMAAPPLSWSIVNSKSDGWAHYLKLACLWFFFFWCLLWEIDVYRLDGLKRWIQLVVFFEGWWKVLRVCARDSAEGIRNFVFRGVWGKRLEFCYGRWMSWICRWTWLMILCDCTTGILMW